VGLSRIVVLGLAAWLVSAAPAAARSAAPLRTIAVDSHYTEPSGSMDGMDCRFETPDCKAHYVGRTSFTGTFSGAATYDLLAWFEPSGKIRYEGPDYITGSIAGCGSGKFILDEPYGEIDMTKFDPVTQSAPGYNTWRVRSGSGTGELAGLVSGSGVNNWRVYFQGQYPLEPDPSAERFGKGHFTGTVTCRVPRRR
jgi:hypothetical protein